MISDVLFYQSVFLAWHSLESLPEISFCLYKCRDLRIFTTSWYAVYWQVITSLVNVDFFYRFESLVSDHGNEVWEVELVIVPILDVYDKLEIVFRGALGQACKFVNFDRSFQRLACEVTNSICCNHQITLLLAVGHSFVLELGHRAGEHD